MWSVSNTIMGAGLPETLPQGLFIQNEGAGPAPKARLQGKKGWARKGSDLSTASYQWGQYPLKQASSLQRIDGQGTVILFLYWALLPDWKCLFRIPSSTQAQPPVVSRYSIREPVVKASNKSPQRKPSQHSTADSSD